MREPKTNLLNWHLCHCCRGGICHSQLPNGLSFNSLLGTEDMVLSSHNVPSWN